MRPLQIQHLGLIAKGVMDGGELAALVECEAETLSEREMTLEH